VDVHCFCSHPFFFLVLGYVFPFEISMTNEKEKCSLQFDKPLESFEGVDNPLMRFIVLKIIHLNREFGETDQRSIKYTQHKVINLSPFNKVDVKGAIFLETVPIIETRINIFHKSVWLNSAFLPLKSCYMDTGAVSRYKGMLSFLL